MSGCVDLWLCDLGATIDDATRSCYLALLDPEERSRWQRLRASHHRDRFLSSHALLRSVLAGYLGREPGALRFVHGKYGKPSLEPDAGASAALSFNLSHSGGRALLAVCRDGGALGVDVERWRADRRFAALARRNFAPEEQQALDAMSGSELERAFYRIWTLKEAYVKARAAGLSMPLQGFLFRFGAGGALSLAVRPGADARPGRWACAGFELPGGYSAAVVHECPEEQGAGPGPRWHAASPLRSWRPIEVPTLWSTPGVIPSSRGPFAGSVG